MTGNNETKQGLERLWKRVRPFAIVAIALVVLVSLVNWGGSARGGPALMLGVGVLTALILAFGALLWWLYLSPLPASETAAGKAAPTVSTRLHGLVAALVGISGMLFVTGAFWDEVWHRRFGVEGNDFLWRPHLLIYGSLALISAFAGGGLFATLYGRGRGSLRARFRSEPLTGLLALVALYLVASMPSDQIWHTIYGRDITAWSLPHLLLAGGFALVMLAGVAVQLSGVPRGGWQGIRGISLRELGAVALVAWATLVLLQFSTAEWEGITSIGERGSGFWSAFWDRPEWLYPVVVATVTVFCGTFILHALKRVGTATLLGLAVLGVRLALIAFFGAGSGDVRMGFVSHLLALAPMVALDLWYGSRLDHPEGAATRAGGSLFAGVVLLMAGLPVISSMLIYPRVNGTTVPWMAFWTLLMSLVAGWAGAGLGSWFGGLERSAADETRPGVSWRALLAGAGGVALGLAFIVLFVLTASPPHD